jgi:HD-GYP domain-containing protein (c-di-GMP phosphodiesterase class II)
MDRMLLATAESKSLTASDAAPRAELDQRLRRSLAEQLGRWMRPWFGSELSLFDAASGHPLLVSAEQPRLDWDTRAFLLREIARRRRPEFVAEDDPFALLAVPLETMQLGEVVAAGVFLTRAADTDDLAVGAASLGIDPLEAVRWANGQCPIAPEVLLRLAMLVQERFESERRIRSLEKEVEDLSDHLCSTYEEISLIYRLTHNLTISRKEEDLGRCAVQWLAEILPAEALVIQLLASPRRANAEAYAKLDVAAQAAAPTLCAEGACPLDVRQFSELIQHLGLTHADRPLVANRAITGSKTWPFPEVRELIVVPLREGDRTFGYLAAINHTAGGEFGSVEANLLCSVGAILAIHRGNTELYRDQADLLANVVRALTSAIDAKDPYTRGHSDRVARVAVLLGRALNCSQEVIDTIYLSGLLHDVGKIGIDDQVLRKPGRLTPEEFEHIKTHTQIGYKILEGIRQFGHVLPVVLHHHEAWDGSGYPHGLVGEDIPYLARIVAVADAFDAMGSDRPYRQGMEDAKIDAIIRGGSGKQWDPNVVEAFFRVRDQIRTTIEAVPDDDPLDVSHCLRA